MKKNKTENNVEVQGLYDLFTTGVTTDLTKALNKVEITVEADTLVEYCEGIPTDKYVFRSVVLGNNSPIEIPYSQKDNRNMNSRVVTCTHLLASSESFKKVAYKGYEIVELKEGQKSVCFATKNGILEYANISKATLISEIAEFTNTKWRVVDNDLKALLGLKVSSGRKNAQTVTFA